MDPRAYRIAQKFVQAHVRRARYAPEFLQWVEGRRFPNPNPRGRLKDILFDSLPDEHQKRIYDQWRKQKQVQEGQRQQQQPRPQSREEIHRQNLDIARHGKITSRRTLSEGGPSKEGEAKKPGVNASEIVRLEHNGQSQIFIRKPAQGEQDHLRMGIKGGTYHQREQAAYGLDSLIGGRGIVPVTHTRGNDDGSYQLWARGARPMHGDDMDELASKIKPEQLLESPDFHRLNVMDLIIGHEDRHNGNLMWSFEGEEKPENLRLVAIDNGLSLASPPDYPGMQVYAHPFGQFFENDPDLPESDAEAQQKEYRKRGNETVVKALSNIDPELHKQLKQVDLGDAAKAMTDAGIDDEKAVRAALVRIAALQEDPKIFSQMMKRQGSLDAAWQDFQFSSGKNDNLLFMAGAEDREKDINRALKDHKPKGGWKNMDMRQHVKDMQDMLADMDGWGDTQPPDAGTRPDGGGAKTRPDGGIAKTKPDGGRPKTTPKQPGGVRQKTEPIKDEIDWSKMATNVMEQWILTKVARRGRKLTVMAIDPRTFKKRELGMFELTRDGKVKEKYRDNRFKYDIKQGIRLMGKKIKPEDGPRFMAALEKVYGARSMFDVKRS